MPARTRVRPKENVKGQKINLEFCGVIPAPIPHCEWTQLFCEEVMTQTATGEDIFLAALDKATPEDRAEFVEAACVGNPVLLCRVRELLAAHDQSSRSA